MGLRINAGLAGLHRNLLNADRALQNTLLQLATGLRINSAADGPAALAISEQLRASIAGQSALIENTQRAANLVQTADAGLTEVSRQLTNLRALAVEAGNTGVNDPAAQAAIQAQITTSVDAIRRIAETTTFGTQSLLNGDMGTAQFQIDTGDPATLTIPDLGPENLGTGVTNASGFLSLADIDVTTAQGAQDALAVIDAAQVEVNATRANLGAFQQNVLSSNVNSLRIARENLLLANSTIRDADIADVATRTALLQTLLRGGVSVQHLAEEQRAGIFLNLFG